MTSNKLLNLSVHPIPRGQSANNTIYCKDCGEDCGKYREVLGTGDVLYTGDAGICSQCCSDVGIKLLALPLDNAEMIKQN